MARTPLARPLNPTWRKSLATDLAARIDAYDRRTLDTYAAKVTNAAALWRDARVRYDASASSALTAVRVHAAKLARMERVHGRVMGAMLAAAESGRDTDAEALAELLGKAVVELATRQQIQTGILRKVPKGDPGTLAEYMKAQSDAYMGARAKYSDMVAVLAMLRASGVDKVTEDEARAWGTRFELDNVIL